MTGNKNLSIELPGNPDVAFEDNDQLSREFKGNNKILINSNKFAIFVCADNTSLSGGGNMAALSDGVASIL